MVDGKNQLLFKDKPIKILLAKPGIDGHDRGILVLAKAIVQNRIVNEPDVNSNSQYLACSLETRSEVVVPVRYKGIPVGEIDIDSDTKGAFTKDDEEFLSTLSELIAYYVKILSD